MPARIMRGRASLQAQLVALALMSLLMGALAGCVVIAISGYCCASPRSLWSSWSHREIKRAQERVTQARELASIIAHARGQGVTRVIDLASKESSVHDLVDELRRSEFVTVLDAQSAALIPLDRQTAIVYESAYANRVLWQASLVMVCTTALSFLVFVQLWYRRRLMKPLRQLAELARTGERQSSRDVSRQAVAPFDELECAIGQLRSKSSTDTKGGPPRWAAIGHDLRAPLTRMRLRAELAPPEVREGMLREIDRMTRLVDLALHALKHESGMEGFDTVNIATLLATVCDEFADVGFAVNYSGPKQLIARCAPESLARAVGNIVDNATKHATTVDVALRWSSETHLDIIIADDGPGMSGSMQAKAFDPFERDPAGATRQGFGLGLSIAADIIEAHDGHIRLQDRDPHGLLVHITLPKGVRD